MRYGSASNALPAPRLLSFATIFTAVLAVDPKHHPFLKRQGCADIQSQCSSTDNLVIAQCISQNLDSFLGDTSTSISGGSATSRASFPVTTRATFPSTTGTAAFQTTSDINGAITYPGCYSLESKLEECQSSTADIFDHVWNTQASCFCYSGSSYQPSSFDNYYSSCLKYLKTVDLDLYSSLEIGNDRAISTPCAAIGDVKATSASRANNAGGSERTTATSGPTPTSTSGTSAASTGASAGGSGSGVTSSSPSGADGQRINGVGPLFLGVALAFAIARSI
ncbi:MAG: hypothetical protein LQ352_006277 [Teloschistes flavicans]|nr:MAG: hypothetical protein LQ352_006277 [Teloschistes flavicans]